MKKIIAFIVAVGMMAGSSFAQSKTESGTPPKPQAQEGWYRQESGTDEILGRVQFFSRTHGWDFRWGGGPIAYRTTNGGEQWTKVLAPEGWSFVYFQNDSTGFAVGNVSRNLRYLIKTTDYGATWSDSVRYEMTDNPPPGFKDMAILGDTMFIVSTSPVGSISTDGGKSWTAFSTKVVGDAYAIYAERNRRAFIVGSNRSVSRSYGLGGGISWESLPIQVNGGPALYDVILLDNGKLIVVGEVFTSTVKGISFSDDNGETWNSIAMDDERGVYSSVDFCDNSNGIIVGNRGGIYRTTNGGSIWSLQNSTVRQPEDTTVDVYLNSVDMVDSLYAWAVGYGGLILHTQDGGKTWVRQTIDVDQLNVQLESNPVRTAVVKVGYTLPSALSVSFDIADMTGRVVHSESAPIEPTGIHFREIPVRTLPVGSYLLRLRAGEYESSVKFQIIR